MTDSQRLDWSQGEMAMGASHFPYPRKAVFLFKALFFPICKTRRLDSIISDTLGPEPCISSSVIFLRGQEPRASLAQGLVHSRCSVNAGGTKSRPWS